VRQVRAQYSRMTRPLPVAAEAAEAPPAKEPEAQSTLQSQPSAGTPDEQQAAKRVQAAYRGHMERRSSHGLALHKDSDKVHDAHSPHMWACCCCCCWLTRDKRLTAWRCQLQRIGLCS
jgi:hypothetical protein